MRADTNLIGVAAKSRRKNRLGSRSRKLAHPVLFTVEGDEGRSLFYSLSLFKIKNLKHKIKNCKTIIFFLLLYIILS